MPEMDGIQTMAALRGLDPDIEIIVLTGHAGVESAVAALKQGACDYLLKPINMPQLSAAATRALERRLSTGLSLYEASRTLRATLERREPILAVLELAQGAMRATAAGLALVPPEGTGLHVDLSRGDGRLGAAAVKRLAEQALQARAALRDPSFEAVHPHNGEAGIPAGSILAFPLEARNATLGALVLWRDKGVAPFAIWEQRRGKILAAEIAIALDNARLSRELSRKAEELAAAQSEAARAEAHARAIVDAAQEAILLFDKEGVVWDLNPKALEMFGRSRDETVGHNLADFAIPARLLGVFKKHVETAYRVGRDPVDKCMELIALRKNGEEFPLELLTTLIETPQGKLLSTFARDITERKQVEQALAQERDLLRALMENLSDHIYFKDRQSRFLRANVAVAKMFGLSDPGQTVGKADFDFFTMEHAQQAYNDEQEVIATGKPMIAKEEKETWPDGRVTWVSTTKMPLRGADGAIIGTFGVSRDITERKRVEEALRESEERYRRLFERNLAGVFQGMLDGHVVDCNDAYARILGYSSRQEILRLEKLDYFYDAQEGMAATTQLQRERSQTSFEIRLKRRDGSPVSVLANVTLTDMGEGRPPLVEGTLIDITERKRAEEQTRLLTAALESAANGIVIAGREGYILWVNPAFTRLTGYPGEEVLGQTMRVLKSGEQDANFYQNLWQTILAGGVWRGELVNRRKDGTLYTDETTITPVCDALGAITHFIAVKQDVTERKRAAEALRASEERYRELFENASDLVFTTDLEATRVTSLNRVAEQTIGYSREEATEMNLQQLVNPRHWERVERSRERLLAGESAVQLEAEITTKDGRRVMLEVKPRLIYKEGKPVEVQGIGRDITGRDVAEMELRHAQKLEAVGRLASGIAHEINTPIQFVGDNTRFLQDSFVGLQTLINKYQELRDAAASGAVTPGLLAEVRRVEEESDCAYALAEIPKALTQTLDGVTRVATIVHAMKDFAHPESKEKAATDLNKALLSTLTVARNELKYVADVETDLGELPPVVCNISDLNQVFLNLLVNAAHAIGEVVKGTGEKGKIRVRTVAEGKTVLITITDTGCGIPEGIRSKVFDPFFTTKEVGRGTGQGLAIARSVVVERHKGSLNFDSEVGKGTTFYIRLPVESGEHSEETKVP
jgi:PAS domain S-box-containing protein